MPALPWLQLVTTHPQLLTEHLQAYAELLSEALAQAARHTQLRLFWCLAAALSLSVAAVLAGVALLLAATPGAAAATPVVTTGSGMAGMAGWAPLWVPLLPLALALGCLVRLACLPRCQAFDTLSQQLALDARLLSRLA